MWFRSNFDKNQTMSEIETNQQNEVPSLKVEKYRNKYQIPTWAEE